jgi:Golgi apparatus protein 1
LEKQDRFAYHRLLAASEDSVEDGEDIPRVGKLSNQCFVLSDIAEPPNTKQAFESSLSIASLTSQLASIEGTTGLPLTVRDIRGSINGISLTGWVAVLGMAALVVVCMHGMFILFKRLRGGPEGKGYTVVVKAQPK